MNISGAPLDNQTWYTNSWLQQKLPKFGFRSHTTALWPVEQSSILSAKFDCPVACQNLSLLATAPIPWDAFYMYFINYDHLKWREKTPCSWRQLFDLTKPITRVKIGPCLLIGGIFYYLIAYSDWLLLTDRCVVVIGCLLIDLVMLIDSYRSMIVRFASPAARGFLSPLLSLSFSLRGKRKPLGPR